MIFTKQMLKEYIAEAKLGIINEESTTKKKSPGDFIKYLIFAVLGRKYKWIEPTDKIHYHKIKRVAVLRYDAIGDYIVSSSAIRWLKSAVPGVIIDVYCSDRNLVVANHDCFVDNSYPVTFKSSFLNKYNEVKKNSKDKDYDLVLALDFSKSTMTAYFASTISKHAEKVKVYHHRRAEIYGLVFNRQTNVSIPGLSWAEKMLLCVTENIEPKTKVPAEDSHPYISINQNSMKNALDFVARNSLKYSIKSKDIILNSVVKDIETGFDYCVINISAYSPNRIWGVQNCSEYVQKLTIEYPELKIFVSGGPAFKQEVKEIILAVSSEMVYTIDLDLQSFMAFVAGAAFVVTPDTAIVHIAAVAKVPQVILFAEKHKILEWFPHNSKFVSILSDDKFTINKIPTSEILEATNTVYSNK